MRTSIFSVFLISMLVCSINTSADMIGSCVHKDKKDPNIVTHCETAYDDEGFIIYFGADSSLLMSVEELETSCINHGAQRQNSFNVDEQCPLENLVGICHDQSGEWGGTIHYYESYLEKKRVTASEIEDQCISGGKIFTKTNSAAEYEAAKNAIPTDLEAPEALALCVSFGVVGPKDIPKCELFHQFTETKTLENRQADCTGHPNSTYEQNLKKANVWATTGASCPSEFNFAVCKSRVVSEYLYEDETKLGPEQVAKVRLASKVSCEASGRRYIELD